MKGGDRQTLQGRDVHQLAQEYSIEDLVLLTISGGRKDILAYKGVLGEFFTLFDNVIDEDTVKEFYWQNEVLFEYFRIYFDGIPYRCYKKVFDDMKYEMVIHSGASTHGVFLSPSFKRKYRSVIKKWRGKCS